MSDTSEQVMARIKLPISVGVFADIAEVLSKCAKADGRTAFTRQVGDSLEVFSVLENLGPDNGGSEPESTNSSETIESN